MKAGAWVSLLVAGTLAMPAVMAAEKTEKAAKEGKGERVRKVEKAESAAGGKEVLGKGFAGMLAGTVTGRDGGNLIVEVTKVLRVWKHSKLENAANLVGQKVTIMPAKKSPNVGRYAEKLNVGDSDEFDVRQDGKVMVWLELTGPQREKIGAAK